MNSTFAELRDALRVQVAPDAIDDVNIKTPLGNKDEASFMRLTSWCYCLLFEAGRITFKFLMQLRAAGYDAVAACEGTSQLVNCLRTVLSHNLGYDDRDLAVRKTASDWFLATCGETYPETADHWELCFAALAKLINEFLCASKSVITKIARSREDKELIFCDLKKRLNRNWPAHRFDGLIEDAAAKLGRKIRAVPMREARISAWRAYLDKLPDDADFELEMERLIDGEVHQHFSTAMPLSARELMEALDLIPGPEVGRAMEVARRLFLAGNRDADSLLEATANEWSSSCS